MKLNRISLFILLLAIFFITTIASAGGVIQLPKTGQTSSYYRGDDGALQKGVAWPTPRFIDNGDGTVTDKLTGLMWTKNANLTEAKIWDGAVDYVKSMNSGNGTYGYIDWRIPNINELGSLIDYSKDDICLPPGHPFNAYLSDFVLNDFWTSSPYAQPSSVMWIIFMLYGNMTLEPKSLEQYVWPVRAGQCGNDSAICLPRTGDTKCYDSLGQEIACTGTGQDGEIQAGVAWPSPRFIDNGDGMVTDKLTGLMWTKNANLAGGTKTWREALDFVENMNLASVTYGNGYYNFGYTDWRLPNINELKSLVDYSQYYPSIPSGHPFTDVQMNVYWSSTYRWIIGMWTGFTDVTGEYEHFYLWPVRTSQSENPTVITLSSFEAKKSGKKVVIKWETGTEIANLGFNILRSESESGNYTKINRKLIKAKGTSTKGTSYKFKDKNIEAGKIYWYKLEDIDSNTGHSQHDAVKVEVTAKKVKAKK